jgi:superfamily II DNA or RNA helicase
MSYAVGSLVRVRGREWVVLPDSSEDLLMVRPLGGTDDEVTGIYTPLEPVEPAQLALPDPSFVGDYRSARLLRDAVRLGFRSSAGPFRSFARIAIDPRPYQLVPLLMALKLDPVRLLIADDVGIGKTIEACLIARELMDRGEIQRLAVLCPPHLAEQWESEFRSKFHIDAERVLPSTVNKLERRCGLGQSLFEVFPFVVVSTDFIKSERRRNEFLRVCPEFVIVDEAHTCAFDAESASGRHQRYSLVRELSDDPDRHVVLVTATPHSGNKGAFRSLLTLLDRDFANLPEDLAGTENLQHRKRLASHLVQRRRADIRHYMKADTPFPTREASEHTYELSPDYKRFFDRVVDYARETVEDHTDSSHHQRIRWWSALALLRALASSPEAAAATLRSRARVADTETADEADLVGRRTVLDMSDDESLDMIDVAPGSDIGEIAPEPDKNARRLMAFAREAERLMDGADTKLAGAVRIVKQLIDDGHSPIVFCRFIQTATYVADRLRKVLGCGVAVEAVTGMLPPADREKKIAGLGEAEWRVLVATDCLSEGINLQEHFDAVVHYDLSWNPTRHEQREGRIDRYGQPRPKVRVVTYYGVNNYIDGIVLDVLLRKHRAIRDSLGISVPVPVDTDSVVEAVFEGLLLRRSQRHTDKQLALFEITDPAKERLFAEWENVTEREKRSRTLFAQDTIKPDEVQREIEEMRQALGGAEDLKRFVQDSIALYGGVVRDGVVTEIDLSECPSALKDAVGVSRLRMVFDVPTTQGAVHVTRTHPFIEGLASYVAESALDQISTHGAARCGVIRTSKVAVRTTLLVVRIRYHILVTRRGVEKSLLAEECKLAAFEGSPVHAKWLGDRQAEDLLCLEPEANVSPDQAKRFVGRVLEGHSHIMPHLTAIAEERSRELLESHRRVRTASHQIGRYRVEPQLPVDLIGAYVYLPTIQE